VGGMSGKAKSRDLAKQETRLALIDAGMTAFSEEGVDLPSLDAICARAGFTRGAFYVHFKDREDFFAAVVDKVLQDFVDWVLSAGGQPSGVHDVVDRFIDVVRDSKVPINDRNRLLMQLVARGTKRGDPVNQPYRALIEEAIVRLADAARQGQIDGRLKRDLDPTQLGLMLVAASVGFIAVVEAGYTPDFEKIRGFMHELLSAPGS
jgi:TetR/AcrR family transcriptional repressor of nem operon